MKKIYSEALIFCGVAAGLATYVLLQRQKQKVPKRYLAISLGGTTARACILQKNEYLKAYTLIGPLLEVETRTPFDFLKFIADNFKASDFDEIAIASFGPLSLKKDRNYGQVIVAPADQKKPWEKFSLANELSKVYKKPVSVETDVNAAAIAEFRLGNHGPINSLAYITIGTGVGVGLVVNGKTVHGYLHPEGGHTTFAKKREFVG